MQGGGAPERDPNQAWAVGYEGTILVTTDGGTTWTPKPLSSTTSNMFFYAVHMRTSTYGCARSHRQPAAAAAVATLRRAPSPTRRSHQASAFGRVPCRLATRRAALSWSVTFQRQKKRSPRIVPCWCSK